MSIYRNRHVTLSKLRVSGPSPRPGTWRRYGVGEGGWGGGGGSVQGCQMRPSSRGGCGGIEGSPCHMATLRKRVMGLLSVP